LGVIFNGKIEIKSVMQPGLVIYAKLNFSLNKGCFNAELSGKLFFVYRNGRMNGGFTGY